MARKPTALDIELSPAFAPLSSTESEFTCGEPAHHNNVPVVVYVPHEIGTFVAGRLSEPVANMQE